jgi:hypothetical protein
VDGVARFSWEIIAVFLDVLLSTIQMSACFRQVCLFLISTFWSAWTCITSYALQLGVCSINFIKVWIDCSAVFQEKFFPLCSLILFLRIFRNFWSFWIYNTVSDLCYL